MDLAALFLLSSGLFLGWSLGANDAAFLDAFGERAAAISAAVERRALALSEIGDFHIDVKQVYRIEEGRLGPGQIEAIEELAGTRFRYRWALAEAMAAHTDEWAYLPESPLNRKHNKQLRRRLEYVFRHFRSAKRPEANRPASLRRPRNDRAGGEVPSRVGPLIFRIDFIPVWNGPIRCGA